MDFNEEDFPLYQQLVKLGQPGVNSAQADFEAALTLKGGDQARYRFALGIQTIAANIPIGAIPGVTKEMNEKTLRSCLKVFEEVASRGHASAAHMVADIDARGLGSGPCLPMPVLHSYRRPRGPGC